MTEVTEVTVRTEVQIQKVARTDSRGGSHNSVALSSAQHFAPHRTEVNGSMTDRGSPSNQTETNRDLSPPKCGTPMVVLTKHNCI